MGDDEAATQAHVFTLLAAAGIDADERLAEDLLPAHRATRRLLDVLDQIDLGEHEPATVFRWPSDVAGAGDHA